MKHLMTCVFAAIMLFSMQPAAAVSVKDSFPDWRNPGKVIVLELTSLKAAGN